MKKSGDIHAFGNKNQVILQGVTFQFKKVPKVKSHWNYLLKPAHSFGKDVGELEPSHTASGNVISFSHFGKELGGSLKS
jgi:hypothetical protein